MFDLVESMHGHGIIDLIPPVRYKKTCNPEVLAF